ncbi:triacylglycerol lipase 2 isoform X2 [Cicer arietinum]|uniref:Lipase n=1 Tax=Cicer arietinum TaxID=3827 RepID=A0A1S2Z190_CICAR|nr:triacylglycerol lipase 2 isoform X2 [Cicer arietinum]
MVLLSLMHFSAFSLCFLVLTITTIPHQAQASSHGSFGRKQVGGYPTVDVGICASSVIVYGYKCQELQVTTKDGYILSLQRIPEGSGVGRTSDTRKQPVILQHGVLVDGMTWLMNPPEQNLPLILADNGFDVWIANTRGTRYSRRHVSLDPSNPAYWNWSWDELVTYDLPAVFDYVFSQTGQKINYVGHSLGTLIALASFSEKKLVNQLKSAALLSPIAYLSHMKTALGVIAAKSFLGEITKLFGLAEFDLNGLPVEAFLKSTCARPEINCYDLLTALTGKNCCLNSSTVDRFLMNEPQSTSTKNMVHLSQIVRRGVLAKFNYVRPDYNIMHYGEIFPPIYNLSNIPHDLPLFISYGGQDALSDVPDVENLLDMLKFHDVDKISVQFVKDYAHADYVMGFNAKDIVYNFVLSFFNGQVKT